jgi:hypothetical protein
MRKLKKVLELLTAEVNLQEKPPVYETAVVEVILRKHLGYPNTGDFSERHTTNQWCTFQGLCPIWV